MGFLSWVADRVKRAAHTPAALLGELHRIATVLWHVLTGLGTLVRGAWALLSSDAHSFAAWVESLAGATWAKLRELFTVTLPHLVSWLLAEAWRKAGQAVGELRSWARTALAVANRYAQRITNDLRSWAAASVKWLTSHVADLVNRVVRLERRVFAILDTPEHLAAWAFGALWHYAWRYLQRGEVAIARWLLRNATALVLRASRDIEAVLADIL